MNARPSHQTRPVFPDTVLTVHLRAVEMADVLRERTGEGGGVTEADLVAAGFTLSEIAEHFRDAAKLAASMLIRRAPEPGDRVPDIVTKVIAAAIHRMPVTAGFTAEPDEADAMVEDWARFCTARAAWKLDPWPSQRERCLSLLDRFLRRLPLLPVETNRVVYALAAHMKVHRHG